MNIFQMIGVPFQYVLQFIYDFVGNYAIAIFIFTVVVNICLSPLSIKQQKTTAKQSRLKPKLDQLKEKYGDDRVKYQNAMADLYQREGVSATSGCLPMLLRMLILMAVYGAITNLISNAKANNIDLNFMFFGINLEDYPKFSTNIIGDFQPVWIIPLLSFATAILSTLISTWQNKKINPQAGSSAMIGMMLFMSIFSLVIAFSVQGAVGFYWVCSNLVITCVQLVVNHFYSPRKLLAMETAKAGATRRKLEAQKLQNAAVIEGTESPETTGPKTDGKTGKSNRKG